MIRYFIAVRNDGRNDFISTIDMCMAKIACFLVVQCIIATDFLWIFNSLRLDKCRETIDQRDLLQPNTALKCLKLANFSPADSLLEYTL